MQESPNASKIGQISPSIGVMVFRYQLFRYRGKSLADKPTISHYHIQALFRK